MSQTINIGFLIYPGLTQLDVTGPAQVLSRVPDAKIHLIWKDLSPVPTDAGFPLLPTTTMKDCPQLNVICVPGGPGQRPIMGDDEVTSFLRNQGKNANYVTSVCSGSLLLGAAGLVSG